jgi:mannose-6-phosphate isomerase-like protein (cupin superfamily)
VAREQAGKYVVGLIVQGAASGLVPKSGIKILMDRKGANMRTFFLGVISAAALFGVWGVAHGRGQAGGPAAQAAAAPKDKAAYFATADIHGIWKDLEARQVINKRVLEGGAYSINIRIVKEGDAPLVHASSADVWVMMEGTATAITGGALVDGKKRPNVDDEAGSAIRGGMEQPLKPGDVLYVPPGVPHGFKDVKGFRAYLIRFDTK